MFTNLKMLNFIMFYIAGRVYNVQEAEEEIPSGGGSTGTRHRGEN